MLAVFYVCMIVLFLYLAIEYLKKFSGADKWDKGYGKEEESTEELLNRIDFANNSRSMMQFFVRYFFLSLIIIFFILSVVMGKLPSPREFLQGFVVLYALLVAFHNFFFFHVEKFSHYAIGRNINFLRTRYGCKRRNVKKSNIVFPFSSPCYNFTFREIPIEN